VNVTVANKLFGIHIEKAVMFLKQWVLVNLNRCRNQSAALWCVSL